MAGKKAAAAVILKDDILDAQKEAAAAHADEFAGLGEHRGSIARALRDSMEKFEFEPPRDTFRVNFVLLHAGARVGNSVVSSLKSDTQMGYEFVVDPRTRLLFAIERVKDGKSVGAAGRVFAIPLENVRSFELVGAGPKGIVPFRAR